MLENRELQLSLIVTVQVHLKASLISFRVLHAVRLPQSTVHLHSVGSLYVGAPDAMKPCCVEWALQPQEHMLGCGVVGYICAVYTPCRWKVLRAKANIWLRYTVFCTIEYGEFLC
jgi:hypothetical protein